MDNIEVLDNQLLVRTKLAKPILESIPGASLIATYGDLADVLVPWEYDACRVLSNIGAPVISPIIRDFEFAGKFPPYSHQLRIASFLSLNKRAYCFAEMGTGKTASAIWAARYLMAIGVITRVLVVAPLTVMAPAWGGDLFGLVPDMEYTVLHGDKKKELAKRNTKWHIINPDGIALLSKQLLENDYDLIIVDELTTYKNAQTARWKNLAALIKPSTWVWGLTGTPTPNGPEEAYGQAKLLTPHTVPKYFNAFKEQVLLKVGTYTWIPKNNAQTTVQQALHPAIRVKKRDCLDLPEATKAEYEIGLTKEQLAAYAALRQESLVEFEGATVSAVNAAVKVNKLLQIAAGSVYADSGDVVRLDCAPRLDILPDIIRAARADAYYDLGDERVISGKTIIYAPFRHTVNLISDYLAEKGFSNAIIDGGVSATTRTDTFRRFQETDELQVIVAVPGAMSHGVTATAASAIVWFAPCASAETYQQACHRIDRPGQRVPMHIIHLYGSPVERRMYKILADRQTTQESILSLYREFVSGL